MTSRYLTDAELRSLHVQHTCPFCGSGRFLEGPHGGLCINIKCAKCEACFNVVPGLVGFGQLIAEPRVIEDYVPIVSPIPVKEHPSEDQR